MNIAVVEPNAKCFVPVPKAPQAAQCETLLDRMPASSTVRVFGKSGGPNVEIALPVKYQTRESDCHLVVGSISQYGESPESDFAWSTEGCVLEILLEGSPIMGSWHWFWATAVAVVAMCARTGKNGVALWTGKPWIFANPSKL